MGVATIEAVVAVVTAEPGRATVGLEHRGKALPGVVYLGGDHEVAIGRAKHAVQGGGGHVMAGLLGQDGAVGQGVALHRVFMHRHQRVVQGHVDVLATTTAHPAQ